MDAMMIFFRFFAITRSSLQKFYCFVLIISSLFSSYLAVRLTFFHARPGVHKASFFLLLEQRSYIHGVKLDVGANVILTLWYGTGGKYESLIAANIYEWSANFAWLLMVLRCLQLLSR